MTDYEAFKWLINNFKSMQLDFSSYAQWEALEKAKNRYIKVYPDSKYIDLLERYHRALYEVASIDYIINIKGGLPNVKEQQRKNNNSNRKV